LGRALNTVVERSMTTVYAIALVVTIASGVAAQAPGPDVRRTPETLKRFESQIYEILFNGIRVSAVQDSSARAIIRESLLKREALGVPDPSFSDHAKAIVQLRDDRLRDLLRTAQDSAAFDANAKKRILLVDRIWRQ
jgi:hypothetical protein